MKITAENIQQLSAVRVFPAHQNIANSLDFSKDGSLCVTSGNDETVKVFNVLEGKSKKTIYVKKYGADLVRCTHQKSSVICASSNGWDESLRHLSLDDNSYIRYYKGHRDRVVSLEISPKEDIVLSGSLDQTVRLWDPRVAPCQGLLRIPQGYCTLGIDPLGMIFAIAADNELRWYDLRNFDKAPFKSVPLLETPNGEKPSFDKLGNLLFSADGKNIVVSADGWIHVYDSFAGNLKWRLQILDEDSGMTISCSPDGQYVTACAKDGSLHHWILETGTPVSVSHSIHTKPPSCIRWHYSKLLLASVAADLAFWVAPSL